MKARIVFAALPLMLFFASPASSQLIPVPRLEVRPSVGAKIPTGMQRHVFGAAPVYGIQGAIEMTRSMHMLGSLGWSPVVSKLDVGDRGADMFEYDLGVEYNLLFPLRGAWEIKPFVGAGAGARTYRYDAEGLESNTPLAAYGSLGTELQRGLAALRIEARGYVHGFTDPITEEWDARNEVGISLGFAYHVPVR
jgi:hypothetical protein